MRLTSARSIFVALALAGISSCQREKATAHTAPLGSTTSVKVAVAWSGCSAVVLERGTDATNDPTCELGDGRTLRFVLPASAADVVVRANDAALDTKKEDLGDERRFTAEIPKHAATVVVVARDLAPFTLRIAPARPIAWLEEARALRAKGDAAKAKAIAQAHDGSSDPIERALAKGLLARLALGEGKADAAFPLFREAIALEREAFRVSDAVDDSFALAFALHQRSHRYAEARAALDAISGDLAIYPEGRAREPYYRGILASETGDRRGALPLLRLAESRARVLGMTRLERNARAALAVEMQALGRARASIDLLRALEKEPGATPCERVEIANDIGWGALLANESAGARVEDAKGPLEGAIVVAGCSDAYLRSFALANLARVALAEGDADEASRRLEAARAEVAEPRGTERMAWLDIEGRVLLARARPREALARFDQERALARAGILLEHEWSALSSRAEALAALGRTDEALAALRDAEDVVDRAALLVPLGEGRGGFVADRSRSARAAVDLLVKKRRFPEAATIAMRSRARVLASVARALRIERLSQGDRARWEAAVHAYRAAREAIDQDAASDWKLARDALEKAAASRKTRERDLETALESAMAVLPTAGTAGSPEDRDAGTPASGASAAIDLVIHPGRTGWYALAIDPDQASAHPLPAPAGASHEQLASALFVPIAGRLRQHRHVRVFAYGAWRAVDVHALPFGDGPLVASLAVDYPLGLRAREPTRGHTPRTLVVGDPRGDLPRARAEAEAVARALSRVLPPKTLFAGEATSRAVREALPAVDLFHYAGHGVFAGIEGWESALPLADGGTLTVGDVLSLTAVPRKVVLSGCEAARSEGEAEGLGLAQAFVTSGAEEAIAPTRPVSDELAAALARLLYGHDASQGATDASEAHPLVGHADSPSLANAMHLASRTLLRDQASLAKQDWAAFRVLAR